MEELEVIGYRMKDVPYLPTGSYEKLYLLHSTCNK